MTTDVARRSAPQLQVALYDNDLATPTFVEDLTERVEGLRFSTGLHGGFKTCTFSMHALIGEQWEWATHRMNYRLVIRDKTSTVWEGRVEEPKLHVLADRLDVVCYGYWASLTDQPYHTAYNANADVIIKAALTAAAPDISADQTHIDATDIAITSAADAGYLDISVQALVKKLLAFSDSTSSKWYFAIWEDRIPYLFSRSVSSLDLSATLEDLAGDPALGYKLGDLWNSCYALYSIAGVLNRTADADDTTSQTRYGVKRQYVVPQLGDVVVASANAQRDIWLAEHKDVWPRQTSLMFGSYIRDNDGALHASCRVRAGEVLRITDLIPVSVNISTVVRDALSTFYVVETDYNADARVLRIIPDTSWMGLDAIIAGLL